MKGKVLQADGKPFQEAFPVVSLHGSTTPFTAETLADASGKFKFKDLLPGTYTLIIAVARVGQMQRTIEIGPSFAGAKKTVELTIRFDSKTEADWRSISARQLSVPESARRQLEKAQDRLNKHDVPGAVDCLKKAVALAPQFSVAWNQLGTIAYQTKDYKQAEQYFREALKQDPDSFPPLVNLGGALLSEGKVQESLEFNLQAAKARPDDALAQSQLGQSYFLEGQLDNAEQHLKKAKRLDPAHFSFPQLVLAEIYQRRGDYGALKAELEEFLRYHPDSSISPAVKKALEKVEAHMK
ncbi:MAG TPA: tetratricopeptide repeat protein [Acidobacteriota bacterium]